MSKKKRDNLYFQKWYWDVWFASKDVQRLPAAAKSLWFELIGLMWNSEERGYLVANGKALTVDRLYRSLQGFDSLTEFESAFEAIEKEGLFSIRKTDGAIYSRKILHDLERAAERSASGRKGGLASLGIVSKAQAMAQAKAQAKVQAKAKTLEEAKALLEQIDSEHGGTPNG